jgi:hypothetical protein
VVTIISHIQTIFNEGKCYFILQLSKYPELNTSQLEVELTMFKRASQAKSISEAVKFLTNTVDEVRRMFPATESLIRLLLVQPISSTECERSFSTLRRLKTWLRATMTSQRLNGMAICNIHHDELDRVNSNDLMKTFVNRSDWRKNTFGSL